MTIENAPRFLRAIAERVGAERVAEVYLFAPFRRGGAETGVAVVAAESTDESAGESAHGMDASPDADGQPRSGDGALADAAPHPVLSARYTIFSARYRHTLKGADRGKWEVEIVPEADAPLETVVAVVSGVQRRAGDVAEPLHLSAAAFRAALDDPTWSPPR